MPMDTGVEFGERRFCPRKQREKSFGEVAVTWRAQICFSRTNRAVLPSLKLRDTTFSPFYESWSALRTQPFLSIET